MSDESGQWLKVGRVSGVHGVKGWLKVYSYTDPPEQIVQYQPWMLEKAGTRKNFEVLDSKLNGKAVIASLQTITDRDQAQAFVDWDILVKADQLPALAEDEFYWHQLEGLRVVSQFDGKEVDLGTVDRLLETGSNDVLVVQGDQHSIDQKERLLPYLLGSTILDIDLSQRMITVDWDPDF